MRVITDSMYKCFLDSRTVRNTAIVIGRQKICYSVQKKIKWIYMYFIGIYLLCATIKKWLNLFTCLKGNHEFMKRGANIHVGNLRKNTLLDAL